MVAYPDKSEVIAIVDADVLAGTVMVTPLEFLKLEIVLFVSVSDEEALINDEVSGICDVRANVPAVEGVVIVALLFPVNEVIVLFVSCSEPVLVA